MTELLLVLAALVMMTVTIMALSQVGRPYVPHASPRVVIPWQPTRLAVTPQEMWLQSLERQIYYGQMTISEAMSALQTGLDSMASESISGSGSERSEPGEDRARKNG